MNKQYVTAHGSLCNIPITLQGIIDAKGEVESLRVVDDTGDCLSWALSDHNISQFKKILKRQIDGR